ncbi:uncharacterized protein LOC119550971 [Drosophila subpulchrella]|uniref:uncharacterized protein LOC119550971 n=1 Tax=Drosophila subpulchrella TaxID=1486046 RepID=UPI0018A1AA13|nr:uncharacterized protein LOC119550971 [Drosophila subpulchrella]
MSLKFVEVLLLLSIVTLGLIRADLDCRMESVEKIVGDEETLVDFNVRLIGRERLLNGTLNILVDLDDEVEFAHEIFAHRNGDWVPSSIGVRYKTCKYMSLIYDKYFGPFFKDSDLPRGKDTCPLKKGNYYFKNIEVTAENWAHYARMGLVKSVLTIRKNNITYGGLICVIVLQEKVF